MSRVCTLERSTPTSVAGVTRDPATAWMEGGEHALDRSPWARDPHERWSESCNSTTLMRPTRTSPIPIMRPGLLFAVAPLIACGEPATAPRSASIALSPDESIVYVANTEQGTVSRIERASANVLEIPVGRAPARIALLGPNRVFVSLHGERALVELRESGGELAIERAVEVGREPFGLAVSALRNEVYVVSSAPGSLQVLDAESLGVKAEIPLPDEPRWIVLAPNEDVAFVASFLAGTLSRIDLDTHTVTKVLADPGRTFGPPQDRAPLSLRLTGDLAIDREGALLIAPGLVIDNATPMEWREDAGRNLVLAAGRGPGGTGRFTPVLVTVPIDLGDSLGSSVQTIAFGGRSIPGDIQGVPTSVTIPEGGLAVVTLEGTRSLAVIDVETALRDKLCGKVPQTEIAFAPAVPITMGEGGKGIEAIARDRAIVHAGVDDGIQEVDLSRARSRIARGVVGPRLLIASLAAAPLIPSTQAPRSSEIALGRRLFVSAIDRRVTSEPRGVSCNTCHTEGRTDGLSWPFPDGHRRTPSLVRAISRAALADRDDMRQSIARSALEKARMMGGHGLTRAEAEAIAEYLETL